MRSKYKVNFLIKSTSGTGIMRGRQVAEAEGSSNWVIGNGHQKPDFTVVVKKGDLKAKFAKDAPVIWDALDFWPQPERGDDRVSNIKRPKEMVAFMREIQKKHGIPLDAIVISVTRDMWRILKDSGVRTFYIPHHYQPGLIQNPIRKKALVLGYEGSTKFLGEWGPILSQIAKRLGMSFVINPGSRYGIDGLAAMDIAVCVRGQAHSHSFSDKMKSGVKIVNCLASGTPFITKADSASTDIGVDRIVNTFFGDLRELEDKIAALRPYETRQLYSQLGKAKAEQFSLERGILPRYELMFDHISAGGSFDNGIS